ncbi:MAG: hypothetical protein PHP51_02130 [Desulfotomaculaceae bacterium]|nr:hypothetical protein [Desulfotomaculaceae bacterium]MDD4766488.1 hypothetical protein [Desulfotomaculaceae bacterium]
MFVEEVKEINITSVSDFGETLQLLAQKIAQRLNGMFDLTGKGANDLGAKKDGLIKMLEGKNEIKVCIYIEDGVEAGERIPSKAAIKLKDDLLILNDMIPIPIDDRYIADLGDNNAEIIFIDPDNQIVHIKIYI